MIKAIHLSIILLFFLNTFASAKNYLVDADFDLAMTHGNTIFLDNLSGQALKEYNFYKDIYNAKKPSKTSNALAPIIPKIMHQIWIGGTDLPPLYEHYFKECKILHPDWEFKLWKDGDIEEFDQKYQDLYNASRFWQGKSDIMRYAILQKYGGVYRDTDVQCIRPIDELLYKYDFFAGLENYASNPPFTRANNYTGPHLIINNGVIGSAPNHKILNETLLDIEKNFINQWTKFDNATNEIGEVDAYYITIISTMIPLSKASLRNLTHSDKAVILPSEYIFPKESTSNEQSSTKLKIKQYISDLISPNDASHSAIYLPDIALMNHNVSKEEMTLPEWDAKNIRRYYKQFISKLSPINKHRFLMADYVARNFPKANFNKNSLIPEKIIFVTFNQAELDILNKNLPQWKLLNPTFEIDIYDSKRIDNEFPSILSGTKEKTQNTDDIRFLLGIEILNRTGGNYADFRAKPLQPIFELSNKWKFYSAVAPLDETHLNVEISKKLIGSEANSPILEDALYAFHTNQTPIVETLIDSAAKRKGIYNKSLILPSVALHPIPYKYGKWSKLWNVITNKRDLYGTTIYSVIE